ARPGCGMIFLPSIKGRGQQLAWLIAMRKRFSLASHAVGLLYSYNCVTNRSLSVETNFPSRSFDCLMHNFIGVNLSITDLIAEAFKKVPRKDRFGPAIIRTVDLNDTGAAVKKFTPADVGGAGRIMGSANDWWSSPGRQRRDVP